MNKIDQLKDKLKNKLRELILKRISKPELFVILNKIVFCGFLDYHYPKVGHNGFVCHFCHKRVDG